VYIGIRNLTLAYIAEGVVDLWAVICKIIYTYI
jgi:hypothetical protein